MPPHTHSSPAEAPGAPPPTRTHLDAWRAGDQSGFATLHARFTPLFRHRVLRHAAWPALRGRWEVDEVVQELWTRAIPRLRNRFEDKGHGSLEAYLGRICDDTVVSLMREHMALKRGKGGAKRLATGFDTASPKPGAATPESPTGHARATELRTIALEVCNEREMEIWEMIEVQGYTAVEVALAMDDSPDAVRGVKHRAKTKIIERLTSRAR